MVEPRNRNTKLAQDHSRGGSPGGRPYGYFFFVRRACGEDSGFREEWFEVLRGGDQFDAFVVEDFGDGAEEHVGRAGAEVEEELGEAPVGADAGEDLLVLDLAGHDGSSDAFGLEGFDEAGELAQGEPVDVDVGVGCGAGVDFGVYRIFLIATVAALTSLLGFLIARTRFGAQVRASVDDAQAARGLGIDVDRVFSAAFALGSGLAGLGGALGIEVLGLDASFPLKFMVYFLLVVVVGGAGSIKGPLLAALLLGVFDVAGKYYVPQVGAFVIYAVMVVLLIAFPAGLYGRRR